METCIIGKNRRVLGRNTDLPMKIKVLTLVCLSALAVGSVNSVRADDSAAAAAADALVLRPLGLVATAVGGAIWVVSLPFTAPGGHVKEAANALVVKPANATFKRPLGEFSSLDF